MPDDNRNARPPTMPPPIPPRRQPTGAPGSQVSQTTLGMQPMAIPSVPRASTQQPLARPSTQQPLARPPTQQVPVARPPTHRPATQTIPPRAQTAQPLGPYATPQAHAQTMMGQQPAAVRAQTAQQPAVVRAQTAQPLGPYATPQAHAPIARAATAPVSGLTRVPHATPAPPIGTMQPASIAMQPVAQPPAPTPAAPTMHAQPAPMPAAPTLAAPTMHAQPAPMPAAPTMRAQPASIPVAPLSAPAQPTASLRPVGIVLPPYVPAPNVGDPAEQDATIPVDKMEFTELVERYDPIVIDAAGRLRQPASPPASRSRDSLLETMPPRFDIRAVGKQILRFWPLIAISALVLVFLGGYMAFDEDGRNRPAKKSDAVEPIAKSEPAKSAPVVKSDEAKPSDDKSADSKPADTTDAPDANAGDAKAGDAKTGKAMQSDATQSDAKTSDATQSGAKTGDATKADAKTGDAKTSDAKAGGEVATPPKPARGKLYIAGDSSVQIYLNGRSANRTAPAQLSLPPGNHKVTLWNQKTGKTTTRWVTIVADKTIAVR